MKFGRKLVCDQLRTSFEAVGVMEFGFYGAVYTGPIIRLFSDISQK